MIPGVTALGEGPTDFLPASLDNSTPNPYWAFFDDHYAYQNFVMVANPPALVGTTGEMPYAIGEYALGELSDDDLVVRGPFRWAWKALETDSTDDPADTVIQSYLINPFNYSAGIPLPGEFSGSGQASFGYITAANVGDLDDAVVNSSWEGRTIDLRHGGTTHPGRPTENVLPFKQYKRLYRLKVGQITASDTEVEIAIRDPAVALQTPIQLNEYAGTGNYEGGDDVKGQAKPVALGRFYEVPAVLVDEENFIYQFHDGEGASVDTVRQNGLAVTPGGDTTDLLNATVSAGTYQTDVSRGLIRLGTEPTGQVTVSGAGVGGSTISSIVQYLVERAGVDTAGATFQSFGQYQAGYWCGTGLQNVDQVITELMGGIDGWWIFNRSGALEIGEHQTATPSDAVLVLEGRQDVQTDGVVTISGISREMGPRNAWKMSLKYRRYWSTGSLSDDVEAEDRSDLSQEYRSTTPVTNTGARSRFEDAIVVEQETHLVDDAEAASLARKLLARESKARGIYEFTLERFQFWANPGDIVTVYHDRFGMSAGKSGRVLTIDDDAATGSSVMRVLVIEN